MALYKGEKVGLVGPNGAGKSTIFRLIMGEESADDGQVSIDRGVTIGYFSQDVGEMAGRSAVAETMDGAGAVSEVADRAAASWSWRWPIRSARTSWTSWSSGSATSRGATRSWAATRWRRAPARSWRAWASSSRCRTATWARCPAGGRCGWRSARILLMRPDAMLLDEPTNHLDIEVDDLAGGLSQGLRRRAPDDLARSRVHEPHGGQDRRDRRRGAHDLLGELRLLRAPAGRQREAQVEAQYERQQAMLAKEMRFIERFKARAAKAAQVQSRVKKLDKIERVEPPKQRKTLVFEFLPAPRSGEDVVEPEERAQRLRRAGIYKGLDLPSAARSAGG